MSELERLKQRALEAAQGRTTAPTPQVDPELERLKHRAEKAQGQKNPLGNMAAQRTIKIADGIEIPASVANTADVAMSLPSAFGRRAGLSMLDLAFDPAELVGNLGAGIAAVGQTAVQSPGGGFTNPIERIDKNFNKRRNAFPFKQIRAIPGLEGNQVVAGVQTADQLVDGNIDPFQVPRQFSRNREAIQEQTLSDSERFPVAMDLADIVGAATGLNVATVHKAGQRVAKNAARKRRLNQLDTQAKERYLSYTGKEEVPIFNLESVQAIARRIPGGLNTSAKTGFEGALLSVANRETSPAEAALFSAGMQAAGSTFLGGASRVVHDRTIAWAAAVIPGFMIGGRLLSAEEPDIVDAINFASDKATFLIGGGLLAGVAGLARPSGSSVGKFLEPFNNQLRGVSKGLMVQLSEMDEADQDHARLVLNTFAHDPDFFGAPISRRLTSAILEKNGASLKKTLDILDSNITFQNKMETVMRGIDAAESRRKQ